MAGSRSGRVLCPRGEARLRPALGAPSTPGTERDAGALAFLPAVQTCQRSSALLTPRLRLDLEQLIADTRRRFEIEIRRRVTHLRLEVRDKGGNVVLSVMSAGFRDPASLFLLAFFPLCARVGDPGDEPNLVHTLLDTHRRDPVLAVVFLLDRATPTGFLDAALH